MNVPYVLTDSEFLSGQETWLDPKSLTVLWNIVLPSALTQLPSPQRTFQAALNGNLPNTSV